MQSLAEYKTTEESLVDKLNWGHLIDDGVVLCKDGSLIAGWFYEGPDLAGQVDSQHDYVSERANIALARLGAGWSIWVEADRLPVAWYIDAIKNHFPDPVSAEIDEERRQHFMTPGRHLETNFAIALQWFPPERARAWVSDIVYSGDDDDTPVDDETLATFARELNEFEDILGGAINLQRMRDFVLTDATGRESLRSQLVNFLQFTVDNEPTSIELRDEPNYLDAFIGGVEFVPGDVTIVGDKYVSCVRISGFPTMSVPGILSGLDALPYPVRFVTRFIAMDRPEAKKVIGAMERKWRQRIHGWLSQVLRQPPKVVDEDAAKMQAQASSAMSRSASVDVGTGYYTPVVVIPAETESLAMARAREVARMITSVGFVAKAETTNTPEALIGSWPGHTIQNVRRPPLHTDNLADMLPLASMWQGEDTNPCPLYPPNSPPLMVVERAGTVPVNLNLHIGDTGGTLMFGPPGSGKSTLLATTALSALRYEGATIWAFDKGMSMFVTTEACGGKHYDFGSADAPKFCPLQELEDDTDKTAAGEWIESCFFLQHNRQVTTDERDAINSTILLMAYPEAERSITAFMALVQNDAVRDAMRYYSNTGPLGWIYDAEHDALSEPGHLVCFEIESLMNMGQKAMVPALFHIFRRFQKALKGQPAFLLLDEVWLMLGHPIFREKIREWLKVLRKANCVPVLATQSLSDAARSGILDVMLEACPTKICGSNPEAATGTGSVEHKGPREYYEMMGYNPAEIEIIRTLTPKREYYLASPEGRMVFDLALGPKARALAGAGSKPKTIARVKSLKRRYGNEWTAHWFREAA